MRKKWPEAMESYLAAADAATWYCSVVIVALVLLGGFGGSWYDGEGLGGSTTTSRAACDEIYVVGEGETLHTIRVKCGDPFIVERNPHIHDPDDVYPGLVIKITPPSPNNAY